MRRLLVLVLSVLLAACHTPAGTIDGHDGAAVVVSAEPSQVEQREPTANPYEQKVYEVWVAFCSKETGERWGGQGSGVVLRRGSNLYLLTAAHVVSPERFCVPDILAPIFEPLSVPITYDELASSSIVAVDYRGRRFLCGLIRAIPSLDVALLGIFPSEFIDPVTVVENVALGDIAVGDPIVRSTFAYGERRLGWTTGTEYRPAVMTNVGVYRNLVRMPESILSGSSGGPVLNYAYELLGLCSCGTSMGNIWNPHSFFTHPSSIQKLLADH